MILGKSLVLIFFLLLHRYLARPSVLPFTMGDELEDVAGSPALGSRVRADSLSCDVV